MSDLSLTSEGPRAGGDGAGARWSWRARGMRALAVLLILAGGLALLDTGITLVWQEPFSALVALLRQDRLSSDLRRVESTPPTQAEQKTLASIGDERRRIAFLAAELERDAGNGSAVGRIVIPQIGANFVVVKGTDVEDLKSGPGVYSETRFPGLAGTTAIAGHRTTYLAPFRHIDALSPGGRILLDMPYAHFLYTVTGVRVVEPTDVEAAVANVGYNRLVLSACTPLFSAAKRLLVFARLTRTVPEGAARKLPGGAVAHPIEASSAHAHGRARVGHKRLPPMLEPLDPHSVAAPV